MKIWIRPILVISSILLLTLGLFQNCSNSELQFADLATKSLMDEFDYNYSQKTSHYLQSVFMLEEAPNPSMKFKVRIFVGTPSWSSDQGNIHVTIVNNQTGQLICPEETLPLGGGLKDWEISCVPPNSFSEARILLNVVGSGVDFVNEKVYAVD